MSSFTPGPWTVCPHAHRWVQTSDSRECIAEVLVRDQMSANARLIAAAPELLAALEEVLHGAIPHKRDFLMTAYARNLVRAAIAKATGA